MIALIALWLALLVGLGVLARGLHLEDGPSVLAGAGLAFCCAVGIIAAALGA